MERHSNRERNEPSAWLKGQLPRGGTIYRVLKNEFVFDGQSRDAGERLQRAQGAQRPQAWGEGQGVRDNNVPDTSRGRPCRAFEARLRNLVLIDWHVPVVPKLPPCRYHLDELCPVWAPPVLFMIHFIFFSTATSFA